MDVKEALRRRRSIRRFKDVRIAKEVLEEILDAGRLAPSGSNVAPLRFYVIEDKSTKKRLDEKGAFGQDFVHKAPAIIAILGEPGEYEKKAPPSLRGMGEKRCLRDLSIASAFMALRATELGLSSCWIGMIDRDTIKSDLKIPGRYILPYVLILGHPDEEAPPIKRKELEDMIFAWE